MRARPATAGLYRLGVAVVGTWVAGRSRTSRLLIGASGLVLLAAFIAVIATCSGALPLERLSTTAP